MTGAIKFETVRKSSASRLVAEQILDSIRVGTLKSGDQIPIEKELMQQFGVGRSTVREGLQILSALNLIESRPGAGTFVRVPNPSEQLKPELMGALIANSPALELLEARQMIEPTAVRLACIRATKSELDRLDALVDEHAKLLSDGKPVHEHAARFHVLLAACSHNQIAVQFMSSIMGLLKVRGRKIDSIPGFAEEEIVEHRALVRHVRSGKPDAAAAAMTAHIIRSAQTYDVDMSSGMHEKALRTTTSNT